MAQKCVSGFVCTSKTDAVWIIGDKELLQARDVLQCCMILLIVSLKGQVLHYLKSSKKWCVDNDLPVKSKCKQDSNSDADQKPLNKARLKKGGRKKCGSKFIPKTPPLHYQSMLMLHRTRLSAGHQSVSPSAPGSSYESLVPLMLEMAVHRSMRLRYSPLPLLSIL